MFTAAPAWEGLRASRPLPGRTGSTGKCSFAIHSVIGAPGSLGQVLQRVGRQWNPARNRLRLGLFQRFAK